jgi:hypothetical protein
LRASQQSIEVQMMNTEMAYSVGNVLARGAAGVLITLALVTNAKAQQPEASFAMPGSTPPMGGPPPDYVAAIQIKDGAYLAEKSRPAAVSGRLASAGSATGIRIASDADAFNGLIVNGKTSSFTLANSSIELSGKGTSDFDGVAAGVLANDGATLVLRNVRITTNGVVSTAATNTGGATLKVYNSTLISHGGPLPSGYVRRIGPGMQEPPTPLGITGDARAHLTMGRAKSYFYDSTIIADGWGALSTDATGGYVYLEANNCDIRTLRSGYGTYADGGADVVFNRSRVDTASFTGIIAGNGKFTFNDITARSGGNLVMMHNVMAPVPTEVGTLTINGGTLASRDAAIVVKSANAEITIDHAKILPGNGDLVLSVPNDDANATKVNGRKVPGVTVHLRNATLEGNLLRLDTERGMTVDLTNTSLKGVIREATVSMDTASRWTATADSKLGLAGPIDVARINAPAGVTIEASADADTGLHGSYRLAGGGTLNVTNP